ncbi:TPD1 protein homolog 1-like [Dioscorea cayenensis subsp. rotundata]|uniref:TPD1 protein homolog 1-like n=1 Tax=Dioscorea cayennensis subsp. rotundata TaxID=55577 RepID=A0AB40CWQ9_DIOCR|nr:TPD1 protein homolog 1-like [Dioscorea cayenensis subsp. rotundata]
MAQNTILHVFIAVLFLLSIKTTLGGKCAPADIFIGQTTWNDTLQQKRYTVLIANVGQVSVTDIHVSCDGFNPRGLIMKKPGIFKKERRGDCLVIEGGRINSGDSVTFDYINDFQFNLYPISVQCLM